MTTQEVISKIWQLDEAKIDLNEAIMQRYRNPDSFDAINIVSERYIRIEAIKESLKSMIEEL